MSLQHVRSKVALQDEEPGIGYAGCPHRMASTIMQSMHRLRQMADAEQAIDQQTAISRRLRWHSEEVCTIHQSRRHLQLEGGQSARSPSTDLHHTVALPCSRLAEVLTHSGAL